MKMLEDVGLSDDEWKEIFTRRTKNSKHGQRCIGVVVVVVGGGGGVVVGGGGGAIDIGESTRTNEMQ